MDSKKHRMTDEDWHKLDGANCPSCGREAFRLYGPFRQCYRCFYKRRDTFLEIVECSKCEDRVAAVKVTTLSNGLQTDKVICPNCGTYYPPP